MNLEIDKTILSDKFGIVFDLSETIKWQGKPNIKSYFLNEIKNKLIGLVAIIGFILLFKIIAHLFKTTYSWEDAMIFFGIVSVFSIGSSVWALLNLRKTVYLITNLSIIIYKDFHNSSTKTIHIKDIQTKELKKTFIDKYLGTGTLLIFTGVTKENDFKLEKIYDNLNSINDSDKAYLLV